MTRSIAPTRAVIGQASRRLLASPLSQAERRRSLPFAVAINRAEGDRSPAPLPARGLLRDCVMVKAKRTRSARFLRAGPAPAPSCARSGRGQEDPLQRSSPRPNPMPERVEPCLALPVGNPPAGPDSAFFEVNGMAEHRLTVHTRPKRRCVRAGGEATYTEAALFR